MNDLKESQETIKQTTDNLKKQHDEVKGLLDSVYEEKKNWVGAHCSMGRVELAFDPSGEQDGHGQERREDPSAAVVTRKISSGTNRSTCALFLGRHARPSR